MRRKRNLPYLVLATALATLAFATPAAGSDVKAVCWTAGEVKMTDKVDPQNKGVRVIGYAGAYTFAGLSTICAGLVKGAPTVASLQLESRGYFHNTICGTGKAVSTANILNSVLFDTAGKGFSFWSAMVGRAQYAVEFVAFTGVFYADQGSSGVKDVPVYLKPSDDPKPGDPSAGYDPAGTVMLTAPVLTTLQKPGFQGGPKFANSPERWNCTKAFHVEAVYMLDV